MRCSRGRAVAETPTCHCVRLRKAVHHTQRLPTSAEMRRRRDVHVIAICDRFVDFVADERQFAAKTKSAVCEPTPRFVKTVPTGFHGVLSNSARRLRSVHASSNASIRDLESAAFARLLLTRPRIGAGQTDGRLIGIVNRVRDHDLVSGP